MHKRMCAYAYNTCSMYECMWTIQGLYAHNVFTYEIFNTIITLVQFQVFLCSDNGFIEIQMTNFPVVKLSYPWKATPDTDLLYRDDIILFTQNARCWYKTTFLRRYCLNKLKKWFRTSASTVIHSVSCSSWQTLAWWCSSLQKSLYFWTRQLYLESLHLASYHIILNALPPNGKQKHKASW